MYVCMYVCMYVYITAQMPAEIMAYLATEDVYAMGYALLETVFRSLSLSL